MEAALLKLFFSLSISFLVTLYLVPLLCSLAIKLGVMDVPDGAIKRHAVATPYLGGIAVYGGFIVALALTCPFENQICLLLIGSTMLLFIGLIDDLLVMKPYQKFFGQVIATFCFLKAGLYLKEQFFYHYWTIPLSAFWILSVINAFNLVDVMDGLATLLAACAAATFLIIALYLQNYTLALLLTAFLGPLLAFLWYNRPPAKIYLGDAGALFIGGFLATVPFLFKWGTYNWYGFATPLVILAIPSLEVVQLIIIRLRKGIPPTQGSPDHFSIYLQANGWRKQAILIYVFSLCCALALASTLFFLAKVGIAEMAIAGCVFLGIWLAALNYRP
jgi:UDP-GlcNAc:undecaprenyl-phosphate GlcNAc-1-phosphate transferase